MDAAAIEPRLIDAFRREGHVVVPTLVEPERVRMLRQAVAPTARAAREASARARSTATYDRAFLQMTNLWTRSPTVAAVTLDRRCAAVAAALLGVPAVRLYHDQALYKQGGGGYTPWHQDQRYWPLGDARTVTMWLSLVDATPEMGTMRFASGSHLLGDLGPLPISDRSEAELGELIERFELPITGSKAMPAGHASFHAGWVVHGAPGNLTEVAREAFTVIYVEDGARVSAPDSDERRRDQRTWLPGLAVGDLVDSPLNPRL